MSAAYVFLSLATVLQQPTEVDVRVGIVTYQDFQFDLPRYKGLLDQLADSKKTKRQFRFHLAPGTYAEVLHWIERGLIDVAVLSPGVFAETQKAKVPKVRYLATMGRGPATSPLALPDRKEPDVVYYQYRSACVVAADSPLQNAGDLKKAAEEDRVQFLFVDPLSVSGRIAPQFALKQIGIETGKDQFEYTYSHSNSLRLVTEPVDGQERVAFVWDDALPEGKEVQVRRLDFPELDGLWVPQDVVAARIGFEHADAIAEVLQNIHLKELQFKPEEDWKQKYARIHDWNESLGIRLEDLLVPAVSLKNIGQDLLHYGRSHKDPPRLALVLSGGGAKCSYQVGAVKALEEMLEGLRQSNPDKGLDIALVVGTSGGAINSLPIALGITSTPEGRADMIALWKSLDQRDLVRPTFRIRLGIGLWLALMQIALTIGIVRRAVKEPARRGWYAGCTFIILGCLETFVGYLHWSPWSMLGGNHTWHHLWLIVSYGAPWTGWFLALGGLIALLVQWRLTQKQKHLAIRRRFSGYFFLTTLLGLPLLLLWSLFFVDKTLSASDGIENVLIHKCTWVIDRQLERQGLPPLKQEATGSNKERLAALSKQIIDRGLLQRDLTMTGSCLVKTSKELPSDLYFFAPRPGNGPLLILAGVAFAIAQEGPRFDEQGVSLAEHSTMLLDVMMGSGAAFPIFPPRILEDFPKLGDQVELVDGGFAHNSPLEAAVRWGATHIVLVEAFLEGRVSGNNLLQNAGGAVEHLWLQAQQVDARTHGKVVIYSLRPQPPHLCLLDFADNLIQKAIDKGYREARGEILGGKLIGQPRFRKELGEPHFWTVGGK
jgi:predicted acylesterase/phospholipase RssA/ABC-type phosphate/phosphonate transport system substrate-binding protein